MSMSYRRIGTSILLAAAFSATVAAQHPTSQSASLDFVRGRPFVMVTVNGKGPFRFVIDTGTAAEAFVTPELAERLGLPVTGQVRLTDSSGQGGQRVPMVLIDSLQVAGVEFTGVKAAQHSLSAVDSNCQGLLGFALFRDYLLSLDYPARRISLASGSLVPDGRQSVLPFRMLDGIPVVPLQIGNLQIEAQIDSGGGGLSLPEGLASRLRFSYDPVLFSIAESFSTRFALKGAKLALDVQLGSYTFAQPFVEINPAFPLANLGSSAMQNFAFTFDQKSGLVRFESIRQVLHLAETPAPIWLQNQPTYKAADESLVPVG